MTNMLTFHGSRDTNKNTGQDYGTVTFKQIAEMAKNPPSVAKEDAQAYIPSSYIASDGRTHSTQTEHGKFHSINMDSDTGDVTLDQLDNAIVEVLGDVSRIIYSSRGSTKDKQKWRAIIPVRQPINGEDYTYVQEDVFNQIAKHGIKLDFALRLTGQPIFLPNKGEFYEHRIANGKGGLKSIDQVKGLTQRIVERAEREEIEARAARAEAKAKAAERQRKIDLTGELPPVDHYNANHDIESVMAQYGWTPMGKGRGYNLWASPFSQSGGPSVRCYTQDQKCVSFTDSDRGQVGYTTKGGHTMYDAFDIYVAREHGGDFIEATRKYAREAGLGRSDNQSHKSTKGPSSGAYIEPDAVTASNHPLAKFVDPLPTTLTANEFVIDGVISAGMVLLAGGWGAGKTSQLIPLMAKAAHLCKADDPLRSKLRRRVIYISEDIQQAQLILKAMHVNGEFGDCGADEVADYFKCVQADRMNAEKIALVADTYAGLTTANTSGITGVTYDAKPVIVMDTRSAVIELGDENDNTEAGAVISTLRQGFPGFPIVIVGHLPKSLKRADTKDMSGRGAGAWEADVQQVLYLVSDDGVRFLDVATPKHRFASSIDGLKFDTVRKTFIVKDALGEDVEQATVYGTPSVVPLGEREEVKREQKALADQQKAEDAVKEMRGAILDIARGWQSNDDVINHRYMRKNVIGRDETVSDCVNKLIDEKWLFELEIPRDLQSNTKRNSYIIGLTPQQRDTYLDDGTLPEGHSIPPKNGCKNEAWLKQFDGSRNFSTQPEKDRKSWEI